MAASDTARIFLALWPDAEVAAAITAWSDALPWSTSARRTAAFNLHLTLHFIGPVPRAALNPLRDRLAVSAGRIEMTLSKAAVWRDDIAVLMPATAPAELTALHEALGRQLRLAGHELDARPYHPHVTLARKSGPMQVPDPMPAIAWQGRGYVLAESDRGYEKLFLYQD